MASLFAGEGQTHKGGFRAEQLRLTFGGTDAAGYMVQNAQFSFSQQVRMLYEIGSGNVYYVGGRAQGTSSLARVVGPAQLAQQFISQFNDICNPQDMTLDASSGCAESGIGGLNYTLEDAVLLGISGSISAQDVTINEQMQFMFIDLDTDLG